jgi:hypothetical protein
VAKVPVGPDGRRLFGLATDHAAVQGWARQAFEGLGYLSEERNTNKTVSTVSMEATVAMSEERVI